MGRASTAVAPQPTGPGRHAWLEVIGRPETPVPRWATSWCGRTGLPLVRRPTLPVSAFEPGPGFDEWSRVAADVATSTAAGAAVLVSRPSWRGPGGPRVVAAVQDLPGDTSVLADAAACATALSATLLLVHGVPVSFAERSIGLDAAVSRGLATLAACLTSLARERPGVTAATRLVRAHPHELVNEELEADLLVVGGARCPSRGLGPVVLSAIRHAPCPVLVAPRTVAPAR